jgi:hypothetical protein
MTRYESRGETPNTGRSSGRQTAPPLISIALGVKGQNIMTWDPPESRSTIVLDDIFDPAKGWSFSSAQVPVQRNIHASGNPWYLVTVDEIPLGVFEKSAWADGIISSVSPNRVVVRAMFTGFTLKEPRGLLRGSHESCGLPSFGLDEQGNITLQAAFPIGLGYPPDLARKQVMVCMGLIAEEMKEKLAAWNRPNNNIEIDWDTVKNVASVAGVFLRAFIGS